MILVTGANGFVGTALVSALRTRSEVRGAVRRSPGHGDCVVGEIGPDTEWRPALEGVRVVIHTAARVHASERADDRRAARECHRVNVEGTRRLAEQAAEAGVRRVIFVSSIKVNGERTGQTELDAFSALDDPAPNGPYARSKHAAEGILRGLAERTGLEVVVVRPPLVYGPGVRANFLRLMRLVRTGIPLPLGAVQNRRSLVALDNLVDLLIRCAEHEAAAGKTFLVSDGEDLSTPELIRRLAAAMGRGARLIAVPPGALRLAGRLAGWTKGVQSLLDSLLVDINPTIDTLGWRPPLSVDEGIRRAVDAKWQSR